MPLISMTGFGRGEAAARGVKVEVELSSLNRRQFEVRLSLPRQLGALESRVDAIIHQRISRGVINGSVKVTESTAARLGGVRVDAAIAETVLRSLRTTARRLHLADDLAARDLLHIPQVVTCRDAAEDTARVWKLLQSALREALDNLLTMRRTEGSALEKDIRSRFLRLCASHAAIRKLAPSVGRKYGKALRQRLADAGVPLPCDDAALLREIAVWADRCDISEEIVRLDSHFKHVEELLRSAKPVGRALDFICQEMFREINTIGSKANDVHISRLVVHFKTELESIREQVQNVE
jgi:uncharacterized protein (TIGR00255 family)